MCVEVPPNVQSTVLTDLIFERKSVYVYKIISVFCTKFTFAGQEIICRQRDCQNNIFCQINCCQTEINLGLCAQHTYCLMQK